MSIPFKNKKNMRPSATKSVLTGKTTITEERMGADHYRLVVDAFDQSNVLFWWADVECRDNVFHWKLHTPQLKQSEIYKLAKLIDQGGLWSDDQALDNARTKNTSRDAMISGADGYRQEFRVVGSDGVHLLSERVTIQCTGSNRWKLAGVVTRSE